MQELSGKCNEAIIVLHGGAGEWDPGHPKLKEATEELIEIAREGIAALVAKMPTLDVAVHCLMGMEDRPIFNAGTGATLQGDGEARLTAALMNGPTQTFSGVVGATNLTNPSLLARELQSHPSRVLHGPGVELLASHLGLERLSPVTEERKRLHAMRLKKKSPAGGPLDFDTVGCVIRTKEGHLVAGTSTGGRGFVIPGRVSDAATVAGTYASRFAAISATGVGEEIVDDALAARIEVRVRDGATLMKACGTSFREAKKLKRTYGWISLDKAGHWYAGHVTPTMSYVVISPKGIVASSLPKSTNTKKRK